MRVVTNAIGPIISIVNKKIAKRWDGLDWGGVPIQNPVHHLIGRYTKQFLKLHINNITGEIDYQSSWTQLLQKSVYYIPFSKKAVDDIIAKWD